MNGIDVNNVLTQMRALSAQAGGGVAKSAPSADSASGSFMDSLRGAVEAVNRQQLGANQAAQDFELGRTDLASAALSLQSAQVSFKAMTEVRNRVVRAYQDIMSMPI
jgi:flagellar hook-basal body complex protein FliE